MPQEGIIAGLIARWPPLVALLVLAAVSDGAGAQATVTLTPSKDNTLVLSTLGGLSNGAGDRIHCGDTRVGSTRRALLAFDLGSIPTCATITSVQLTLSAAMTRAATQPVTLQRLTQDWGEAGSRAAGGQGRGGPALAGDATWTQRFHPATPWSTEGGDFTAAISASADVSAAGAATWGSTAAMVADAQGWLNDPASNFGWIVRSVEGSGSRTARAFHSREASSASLRPTLQVTYTSAAVASVGTGCTGSGVSPFTATASGLPTIPDPAFSIGLSGGPPILGEAIILSFGLLGVPTPFGAPGCSLLVDVTSFGLLVPGAAGTVPLPIPPMRPQLCVTLPVQGIAFDANTNELVLSNALLLSFGK